MYTRIRALTTLLLAGIFVHAGQAQEGTVHVLEQYVNEALQSNLSLQQERNAYEQSLQTLAQSKALFVPSAGISATYSLAQGGRSISIPVGDLLNPVYATLNQLTDSQMFPPIPNVSEQFLPNRFHETKLRVIQPLFNSDIWYNYKAQQQLVSVQEEKRLAYENELKGMVREAYFDYLQVTDAVRVYEGTLTLLDEQVRVTERFFAAQIVTKDAVYNAQLERSKMEAQLVDAQKNERLAKSYFNFLLNRELASEILTDERFTSEGNGLPSFSSDLDALTDTALRSRSELAQLERAAEASNYLVKMNEANRILPNLSLIGDVGYQGFDYKFNGDQQFSMLIFSLQWDLFKGGARKSKYQSAVLQRSNLDTRQEELRRQIELQVMQAYEEAKTAAKNLETAETGLRAAENSFRITQARFDQHQVLPIEFQQSQNNYTNAQLGYSIARFNLYKCLNQLDKTINQL